MKKCRKSVVVLLSVLMVFAGAATAIAAMGPGMGNNSGNGNMGQGMHQGNMPPQNPPPRLDIFSGTPVTVTGTVSDVGTDNRGLSVDTGSEVVTVYGIGPDAYWEELGVTRPAVGDEVTVNGYVVEFSDGNTRIITASMDVNGTTVQLVDLDTGRPLWVQGPGAGQGNDNGNGGGQNGMPDQPPKIDIFSGTPVLVEGVVAEATKDTRGLAVDTGSEVVMIYGIGPETYWEKIDVPRPETGDSVTVNGYEVEFSDGSKKIIAASIIVNGTTVELVDPDTGRPVWARQGGQGQHPEPIDILSGTPVTITGVIAEIPAKGRGMEIDTGSETVSVFGMGPLFYWEDQGLARPEIGDEITIDGYEVSVPDGSTRIIAMSVTKDGVTLQLRDAATGEPLWPKPGNGTPVTP